MPNDGALFAADQKPAEVAVTDWSFRRHEKPGKPDCLKVFYRTGLLGHSEWICFEHGGAAAWRAVQWWICTAARCRRRARSTEALSAPDELTMPSHIRIRRDGEFWKVIGHEFRRTPHERVRGSRLRRLPPLGRRLRLCAGHGTQAPVAWVCDDAECLRLARESYTGLAAQFQPLGKSGRASRRQGSRAIPRRNRHDRPR